uniref:WASP homolog-associated protein with actin, membranes and microtubules n=1 Tax=Pristiophorus japonicus TaxID=55135 RepID=UPI00398F67F2
MDAERPDSLEGWVAIRPDLFEEAERLRLRFLVAWNEVEGKFAVTCHKRPLRRSAEPEAPEPASWAALYDPHELRCIHRQLTGSCAALEPCLPALPELRRRGLWGLLFPGLTLAQGPEPAACLDTVCRELERYLGSAAELCGRRVLLESLFPETGPEAAEHDENLGQFRRRSLEQRVGRGRESLRQILHQHRAARDMVALQTIYQEEDEAYQELVTVATQFYQYLLQPFRDMREFASLCKQEALLSLSPLPLPTGTMDDVLASLKRGEIFLKKVDRAKQQTVGKSEDVRDSLLAEIRQGIPLRKVTMDTNLPEDTNPANELERSIKAAMKRMKKVSPDSDDEEDDGGQSGEWDS